MEILHRIPTPLVQPPPSEPSNPSVPNPPIEPGKPDVPNPPVEPDKPIDKDPIKRTINVPYLENLIQTNDLGYNPDSLHKTILKYQKENNQEFLNKILVDKPISNWKSIEKLAITPNDKDGKLSLSFDYGGTHSYSVNLTKTNGLLSDADYYKKLDDLSFAFRISYASIASGRNFPVLGDNNQVLKNPEGMARAQYKEDNKGTWINGDNQYLTESNNTGTAWLVDYIPNKNANENFYEFIVATNIHVSDMTGAFYLPRPLGGPAPGNNHSYEIALDPIYIKSEWAKPKGKLNFENPNIFSQDNFIDSDTRSIISNLTFQNNIYGTGNRETKFLQNVIKNTSRVDNDVFSTWDHPQSAAIAEKESILNSISFYEPSYQAKYTWNDNELSPYWKNQLKDNAVTYNNIQPDLTFLKMQFNKNDLKSKWPNLLNAIEANKMDEYLLPLATNAMNPENDISYYYAGFPFYRDDYPDKSVDIERQAYNGYDDPKNTLRASGHYYRWGKTFPKILNMYGVEQKFDVHPNTLDFDYVNEQISYQMAGYTVKKDESYDDWETDTLFIRFDWPTVLKKFAPYDEQILKDTILKQVYVNTKSDYVNKYITKQHDSKASASSPQRGMIKQSINGTKKYYWGTSEFIMGGNSGSMVLSPKLEITGIISSRKGQGEHRNLQCLIESTVNTADNIISGEKVIWKGIQKKLKSAGIKTILYNK